MSRHRLQAYPDNVFDFSQPKQEVRCWHVPELDWPVGDRLVRVVQRVRMVSQAGDHQHKSKT